jgi:hypothetical protein
VVWVKFIFYPMLMAIFVSNRKENNTKKLPIYQKTISIETQVGITSQIKEKWATTDPRTYRRWDQVSRRSKHPCRSVTPAVSPVPLS